MRYGHNSNDSNRPDYHRFCSSILLLFRRSSHAFLATLQVFFRYMFPPRNCHERKCFLDLTGSSGALLVDGGRSLPGYTCFPFFSRKPGGGGSRGSTSCSAQASVSWNLHAAPSRMSAIHLSRKLATSCGLVIASQQHIARILDSPPFRPRHGRTALRDLRGGAPRLTVGRLYCGGSFVLASAVSFHFGHKLVFAILAS